MRIVVTGTPGTGKTRIAKALAKRTGAKLIGLREFVNENHLFKIRKGQREKEVDIAALRKKLLPCLARLGGYIVEGHLACEMRLPVDFVFVLRTSPKELEARLAKRHYPRKKLEENLMAEMLDYCTQRAEKEYGKAPLELDTTRRSVAGCAGAMLDAIKRKKKKLDCVDYSSELEHALRLRR